MKPKMLKSLLHWIVEREAARIAHDNPGAFPEDKLDPIIAKYRFCNVNREHDRVTQWIDKHIRKPMADHPALWFNLVIARFINWPPGMTALGMPLKRWDPKSFMDKARAYRQPGQILYGPAYVINAGKGYKDKIEHLCANVFSPMWALRKTAEAGEWSRGNCGNWADWLQTFSGVGAFMANQIVTDMKYTRYLKDAPDRANFVLAGPGTQRGLNRLYGFSLDASWDQADAQVALCDVREALAKRVCTPDWLEAIEYDLNNLSNCMCEFDKYRRALDGGKPKQLYKPHSYAV